MGLVKDSDLTAAATLPDIDGECYTLTGRSPRPEVSWSGIGSLLSALATCDADMW